MLHTRTIIGLALGATGVLSGCEAIVTPAERIARARLEPPTEVIEAAPTRTKFLEAIPSAAVSIEMIPVPGDEKAGIKPFFMSKTEIPWEVFDVYAYQLDAGEPMPEGIAPDAISRPSKPYLPPDRGFGHDGYAAISLSYRNAAEFCVWLSARTGRKYRLATVDEWAHAALAGSEDWNGYSDDPGALKKHAWFVENAGSGPRPVATLEPNAWGLYDMYGNVLEWCVDEEGKPAAMGGCYSDPADKVSPDIVRRQDWSWNSSDPQVPKSKWWLSDGPFVGFRIVCEDAPAEDAKGVEQ